MGTFVGHFLPGFALALLGLWHIFNTARAFFFHGSNNFKSRFSYPLKILHCQFQNLDLILILSFSIPAIVTQVFDFPVIRLVFRLDNLEHASMFLHLLLFSGFTLLSELTQTSENLSGVIGILASSVFGQELFLLHFHSTDHVGIEGHYHWLLQLIVLVSFLSAITVTLMPTSLPASLVLAVSVTFQGLWFINMGFMLWVPELVSRGCSLKSGQPMHYGDATVVCGSKEADFRARAVANLQFSWILSTLLVFTGSMCLKLARSNESDGKRATEYQKLQSSRGVELYPALSIGDFKQDHSLGL
ncbi:hypothetical protein SAY87_014378 [Trapa incisa]|uniref:Transmembrane protein 45B n=1 Tax=Trapa incisa TaxID=236973 RepID=A0AAN7H2R2_9MYRT|nr:hypothetical protein SAY87_014378 [Trapa incisa]